ncbi:hypothetical protein PG997_001785 [Apiospora hydei]|uniref:DUF7726 domain-containing protein n=1 Tax=Apiospora hydei TaxID=1337664 RepID=A0ABR1X7L6_9PEZI
MAETSRMQAKPLEGQQWAAAELRQREERRYFEERRTGREPWEIPADVFRDIALDEIGPSIGRPGGDRYALMRTAGNESSRYPANRSVAFGVLKEANAAAVERGKTVHRAATAGRKRKSGPHSLQDDIDNYKQSLAHIDTTTMHVDLDCDQVRDKINKVLESGIFKKTEFCDAIVVSNAAVNAGPDDGSKSDTFTKAWDWFKREIAGLRLPNANKRRQTEAARAAAAATALPANAGATTGPSTAATRNAPVSPVSGSGGTSSSMHSVPDISGIHLPGEDTDEVPVYDTCDMVREKIDAHLLAHKGLTQAQFCRDIYAHGLKPPTRCKGIQPKQLSDFRHKQGSNAGATSSVFYAAYVYFEKIRLAQGAPKSAHRLEMERRWGSEGSTGIAMTGRRE